MYVLLGTAVTINSDFGTFSDTYVYCIPRILQESYKTCVFVKKVLYNYRYTGHYILIFQLVLLALSFRYDNFENDKFKSHSCNIISK